MKRTVQVTLDFANTGKKHLLLSLFDDYKQEVQFFIDYFWKNAVFSGKFVDKCTYSLSSSDLPASLKQKAAQQALQTVKSQRKKKRKSKPYFNGKSVELDQRFVRISQEVNSFDLWFHFRGLGFILDVPSKKHKHFNQYKNWNLKKSIRLRNRDGKLLADLFFEASAPAKKTEGGIIGIDQGYRRLAVTSSRQILGPELPQVIEKITRKQRGSKNYQRALRARDNYIDYHVKQLPIDELQAVVIEDLKNVKHKSKFSKKVNNKLQYWTYTRFVTRLEELCELNGVRVHKVNPRNTSRQCSVCGYTHEGNRKGDMFLCLKCGHRDGADFNAPKIILMRFLSGEPTEPRQESCSLGLLKG